MTATSVEAQDGCARKCEQGRCPKFATCLRRIMLAQRTRAELSALSDAALKDVGLFRGDIHAVTVDQFT